MALFAPFNASLWIGRASQILICWIGAAAIYLLGRRIHSHRAGLVALMFLVLCTALFFFDRLIGEYRRRWRGGMPR
jgi:hypothetical protein